MNALSAALLLVGIGIASISRPLNPGYGFTDSLWPALVGLCVASSGWIYFQAEKHAELSKTVGVNHTKWWLIRLVVGLAFCLLVHAYSFHWVKVGNLLIFGGFWFGLLFNLSYNHFKFLPYDYIARTGKNRAIIDTVFSWFGKQGGKILILVEALGMALSGYVYILR